MTQRFEREWKPEYTTALSPLGISRHDAVTMASIVEKEAKLPEERPVIAAVYYNRLRKHMLLQADPTVQYALGHHVERVYYKDLTVNSPYNTYTHAGLLTRTHRVTRRSEPPSRAAPRQGTLSVYFVAAPDGHHELRTTLAEHMQQPSSRYAQCGANFTLPFFPEVAMAFRRWSSSLSLELSRVLASHAHRGARVSHSRHRPLRRPPISKSSGRCGPSTRHRSTIGSEHITLPPIKRGWTTCASPRFVCLTALPRSSPQMAW